VVNTAGQLLGVLGTQGVRVPGVPPPVDFSRNAVAGDIVASVAGPNAIGFCCFTSFAVLVTGEADARAPFLALAYYHLSNAVGLGRLALAGKQSPAVGDPLPGLAFHGPMFLVTLFCFVTAVWDRAASAPRAKRE